MADNPDLQAVRNPFDPVPTAKAGALKVKPLGLLCLSVEVPIPKFGVRLAFGSAPLAGLNAPLGFPGMLH